MGTDFRVSGTSVDGTNIVNTTVYVRTEDFERLRGDNVAYVLVGAEPGVEPGLLDQARRAAAADQQHALLAREEGRDRSHRLHAANSFASATRSILPLGLRGNSDRDRKSTRLNSSH